MSYFEDPPKTAIFVPTLWRHSRISGVIKNIQDVTPQPHTIYFICEVVDEASIECVRRLIDWHGPDKVRLLQSDEMSVPKATNLAYRLTREPLIYAGGSDDQEWCPGWLANGLKTFDERPDISVVGCWDGYTKEGNAGFLMKRSYIDEQSGVIDESGKIFREYNHYFADTEFWYTAVNRGVALHNENCKIVHNHYSLSSKFGRDNTYDKNEKTSGEDQEVYQARRGKFRG